MNGISFVEIGGVRLNEAIVRRVEVVQRLNDHWFCEVECRNTTDRPIPGAEALGAPCQLNNVNEEGTPYTVFAGVVIDVQLKHEVWGSYSAVIRAASRSWLMDQTERRAYFPIGSLNKVAASLGAVGALAETPLQQEYVQFDETDWQFLLRLADDGQGWLRAGLGAIEMNNQFDAAEPLVFRGVNGLLEFFIEGELGPAKVAAAQYDPAAFMSQTWAGEQLGVSFEAPGQAMGSSVQAGAASQGLLGYTSRARAWDAAAMQARAQAEAARILGAGVVAGGTSRQQTLTAGASIEVQNCRDADGTYHLIEVRHEWTSMGYVNHFLATSWSGWYGRERVRTAVAPGVQAGRVTANYDPLGRGRLQVSLHWQDGANLVWAPMASLHCGAGFGLAIMPEIGDEVLVGFTDADPERPVILGSLWNGVQQPPRQQFATGDESQNNLVKRLITKSGVRIHIVDTPGQEAISLATPKSNHLILSEKVVETQRPALGMYTLGDIHLHAAGRIHHQAASYSNHVDGKIQHRVQIRVANTANQSLAYQAQVLGGSLTDGSPVQVAIADGQHFQNIPQGNSQFHFTPMVDAVRNWELPDDEES